ncbi:hypothetical protein F5144DRAFT_116043 [Chaetomium tenue]|uniref:Uncharacterized protein n=1 Tax=Chaetomium tenue TaxID=1854479 RepID=A0ACB7PLG3_9PEZI|nr:hypothetical protein F5144DRAFT_116043 [Chaetomium globosum]
MDIDPPAPQNDPTITTTTNPAPHPTSTPTQTQTPTSHTHTHTLTTLTLKSPPSAYAHLSLTTPTTTTTSNNNNNNPDILQLRAYLTTALRQFLGDTGAAIPIDFLAVGDGGDAWVRVPRADLAAFVGAVTAFGGMVMSTGGNGGGDGNGGEEAGRMVLRVVASGDWLGSLIGKEGEGGLWAGLG